MRTLLDTLHALALLFVLACVLSLTLHGAAVLDEISRELMADRARHEQVLREHVEALRAHQQFMENHSGGDRWRTLTISRPWSGRNARTTRPCARRKRA